MLKIQYLIGVGFESDDLKCELRKTFLKRMVSEPNARNHLIYWTWISKVSYKHYSRYKIKLSRKRLNKRAWIKHPKIVHPEKSFFLS